MTNKLCVFCGEAIKERVVFENGYFYMIYDLYPVSIGHALFIPKRHVATIFLLTDNELVNFFSLLKIAKREIDKNFHPNGYNIGINSGAAAGQTIFHLHIHLIPRYIGDVENPVGGVRNIIANLVEYPIDENQIE